MTKKDIIAEIESLGYEVSNPSASKEELEKELKKVQKKVAKASAKTEEEKVGAGETLEANDLVGRKLGGKKIISAVKVTISGRELTQIFTEDSVTYNFTDHDIATQVN